MSRTLNKTALRQALVGGGVAAGVMTAGALLVGLSGLAENPRALLQAALSIADTLFSTAMIASSTMLALMLTMLGMTSDEPVKGAFYGRVRQAALLATGTFCTATVFVLFLLIPLDEGQADRTLYEVLYYVITTVGALVGGALVALVLTLYGAITSLISLANESEDAGIAADEAGD